MPDGPGPRPSLPPDPFGGGRDGFVQLHVVKEAMQSGGFSRFEALFFLAANVAVNGWIGRQQPPEGQGEPG